jgi:putative colanic acid biosynthesis acetyltransferase WcaF
MQKVSLSSFNNSWYKPGHSIKRFIWYYKNLFMFKSSISWPYRWKRFILRIFGATVGMGVVIKPCVNIKYPWFLELGDNVWIGEEVRIDNLGKVKIGNDVCISQGAFLLTGNHNYTKSTFDLMINPITIEDGVWVGAKAIVCSGVTMHSHSVLTAGSTLTKDSEPYTIYQGNPAVAVRKREIK